MRALRSHLAFAMCVLLAAPIQYAANHRESPVTALDSKADITDFFAFVSYDSPDRVTFIMNVDPLLEPGNGPNYFPFDPDILYAIRIDNNHDAVEDIVFEFRFQTEIRAPGVFTGFVGAGNGVGSPSNAPAGVNGTVPATGSALIPPAITSLDGPGSAGFSLRQTYTVTMVRGSGAAATRTQFGSAQRLIAVPSNVGPRTMPDYAALARQGIYSIGDGARVFAGTVDDPFFIDLGAIFDSLNLRPQSFGSGLPGVLTPIEDLDANRRGVDYVAGYNVNSIAIEVPIAMIVSAGRRVDASDPRATIGAWATTSRPRTTTRTPGEAPRSEGDFVQIQRMGHPLINEVIIGTGSKDKFSFSQPKDDVQFASFALDPLLARAMNAVFGLPVPNAPRTDLLLLVQYAPPIAAPGTPPGPVADLLRLNTGISPAPQDRRSRLGVLGGDLAGWPNGRRVSDDVTDIALRAVAGVLAGPPFNGAHLTLGDGVNTNDRDYQESFPYVAFANSGYNSGPARMFGLGSPECVRTPNLCR